jgi:hypothetical protein
MPDDMKQMMDTFDPNDVKLLDVWCTVIPSEWRGKRRDIVSLHRNRRAALSRFGGYDQIMLFHHTANGWELAARKCRADHRGRCTVCDASTIVHESQMKPHDRPLPPRVPPFDDANKFFDTGKFALMRVRNKITDPIQVLYLCEACRKAGVDRR